jgi:hypothetical protein
VGGRGERGAREGDEAGLPQQEGVLGGAAG